jgi:5'-nucleotidase (lipoprotein e(P4) family)
VTLRYAVVGLAAASFALSGCVAAVVPVAAAGVIGNRKLDEKQRHGGGKPADDSGQAVLTPANAAQREAFEAGPTNPPGPTQAAVPPSMQYLYGSGEAAALSIQSYYQMANFVVAKASDRAVGHPVSSVVLAPGATLDDPKFVPCGDKPLAIVLDIDETTLLNYGFEGDQASRGGAYDQQRWNDWERTGASAAAPVPGVADALKAARIAHVTVVFNSNRAAANADATAAAIDHAGLGPAVHGDTLWLEGDTPGGSDKDQRRWAISARYCVIAMAGDQLGDFSDLFNAHDMAFAERRAIVASPHLAVLWGEGWFMLPNPVYGTALKGVFDEVFPIDKRWTDPADDNAVPAPAATGSSK